MVSRIRFPHPALKAGLVFALPFFLVSCASRPVSWEPLDREDLSHSFAPGIDAFVAAPLPVPATGELGVEEAVEIAVRNSPTVGYWRARILRAEARIREARSAYYPFLTFSSSARHYLKERRDRTGDYRTGLELEYPLYLGGVRSERLRAQTFQRVSQEFEYIREKDRVGYAVRGFYYEALLAREMIGIASAARGYFEGLRDAQDAFFRAGQVPRTDVLTFQTRIQEAESERIAARKAYRLARMALEELLAGSLNDEVSLVFPEIPTLTPEEWNEEDLVQDAWNNRADLRALRNEFLYRMHRAGAIRGEYLPRIDLRAGWESRRQEYSDSTRKDDYVDVEGILLWEILDGGSRAAQILEQDAEAQAVAEEFREVRLAVRSAVKQAVFAVSEALEQKALAERILQTAREAADSLADQYRVGKRSILEVLDGERRLTEARLRQIEAEIGLLSALNELSFAVGR